MRRTFAEPEGPGIFVRTSNKRLFLVAVVLEWLSARDGDRVPAREWSRCWIIDKGLYVEPGPEPGGEQTWLIVRRCENSNAAKRRWGMRRDRYFDRLRALHAPPAKPAVGAPEARP
jgi:hypothetical protein